MDQRGTYVAAVVFGTRMAARRRGSIVNIASVAGMRSMPLHAYAPAKAAVIAMTECLAAEWGPAQVRVNAVSPGYTRTPALQAAIDKGERDVSALERNAALGRLVEPTEIARAVAFLASPDAAAITGANLPVDCGWLVAGSWHTYGGLRQVGSVKGVNAMTALAMSIARFVAAMDMNAPPRNPCWRKPRLGAPCTSSLRPLRHALP